MKTDTEAPTVAAKGLIAICISILFVSCVGPYSRELHSANLAVMTNGLIDAQSLLPVDMARTDPTYTMPPPTNGYHGISIGMLADDVFSKLGQPSCIATNDDTVIWTYHTGHYRWMSVLVIALPVGGRERYEIEFTSNKVERIVMYSSGS